MLAIASLMVFIVAHHRRNGEVLSQSQEELILVSALGLFWFAVLMAWRAMNQGGGPGQAGELNVPSTSSSSAGLQPERAFTGGRRPWPCSSDDYYCVVEEWSYY
ncbi:hypothetical protein DENSPDRAFT_831200 [Dentipellis sp. KUC8613]|nr:hypothetical protein DENSPDRAFT_831200 [Dentipellis sp. KUC8613]